MKDQPYFIGIAGGSASGKTSILNELFNRFGKHELSLVSQDNYYRPAGEQQADENGWLNFDLPDSIHRSDFYADLMNLSRGEIIEREEYTFNNPAVKPGMATVSPTPVVISEGLFVFHYEEVRSMLDFKVYIDAAPEIRLQRRIQRDALERGYPEHEVRYQWDHHVRPADRLYLEPFREHCDLVIENNHSYSEGLEALESHIRTILEK